MDLEEIRPISTRSGRILMIFWSDMICVLIFSTDRIENRRDSSQIWSGPLKIGFSASNSPTDPPFSSSGGRDSLLTCHRHLAGRSSGRIEWFLQVGRVQFFLDTPSHYYVLESKIENITWQIRKPIVQCRLADCDCK